MSSGVTSGLARREPTQDPLAFSPNVGPAAQVAVGGVRDPRIKSGGGDAAVANAQGLIGAIGGLQDAVSGVMDQAKDRAITEGKIAFEQGKTLEEVQKAGNDYTTQGWQSLSAVDQANKWFTQEAVNIAQTHYDKTPEQYAQTLNQARAEALKNLPDDPAVRKIYAAAFEDMGPRLASAQIKANSEYQEKQTYNAFSNVLASTATTSAGATRRPDAGPITQLRVSQEMIDRPYQGNDKDRDIAIRTMLGEAGGEGEIGMAAVAHVMKNRQGDSRWGGTIASVALAPKQFSAWNPKSAGGVDLVRSITPDNPMYQKAGLIYDAVMGGHTVDPTGGATHYYAPKGMPALVASGAAKSLTPGWAAGEAAKNEVRIGNHVFAGKAGGGGPAPATMRFGLGGVVPAGPGSAALPPDLTPTTSATPAPVPGTAGNERQTQLLEGTLEPQTEEDRQYVKANSGGVPQGTQIDVKAGSSPGSVAKAAGIDTAQPARGTQVRELIMGFNGMKPEKKAAAVADQMRRQLAVGDDTLFNDAGGLQTLRDLGAQPGDIDEVLKAKKAFDKESLNRFNVGWEKERSQLLQDAGSGNFTEDQIGGRVKQFYQRGLLNDGDAKSLVRDALDKVRTAKGDGQKLNLELQDSLGNLYQGVRNGVVDAHEAGNQMKALAQLHNVPQKELEGYVSKAYELEQGRQSRIEAEARANAKSAADQQVTKDLVDSALKRGTGLSNITGTVKVQDDDTGHEVEISARQYGVKRLSDGIKADLANRVKSGDMDPQTAGATFERMKFEALAKQNVVDDDFRSQIKGALTGNIIDPKTKLPSSGAKAAFDMYLRLGNNPNIGDAYLNQYLDDPTKALVTTAKTMYDGRMNIEDALVKAHALLNDPASDPGAKYARDITFNKELDAKSQEVIAKSIGTDSWMRYLMGTVAFGKDEQKAIVAQSGQLKNFIGTQADGYKMQFPNMPAEVALKMAAADAPNRFIPTKGGLLYGNPERGERLDQAMGIEGYPKDQASQLIDEFVTEQGPKFWKQLYTKRAPADYGITGKVVDTITANPVRTAILGGDVGSRNAATNTPAYDVQYIPDQKLIGITLLNNAKERQQRGAVMWVRADALGARFVQKERKPSTAANVWDTISRGVADTLYGNRKDAAVKQGYDADELNRARTGGATSLFPGSETASAE
jgi:spore germination cell wall hydrolase CwlJ-like protein